MLDVLMTLINISAYITEPEHQGYFALSLSEDAIERRIADVPISHGGLNSCPSHHELKHVEDLSTLPLRSPFAL